VRQRWPEKLWIVRHGQSAGNVARDAAHEAGLAVIDIAMRDVDVPLSDLGLKQGRALGRWFASMPEGGKPEVVLSSPYVRARQTAKAICEEGGVAEAARQPIVDERLREREFGVFDRLTSNGIAEKYPDLAEHRAVLGKFYHRAPGGESWADVIIRLRSYILEEMDEAQILAIDKEGDVVNCGVCEYDFEPDGDKACVPRLIRYNFAAPLIEEAAPVTSEPDAMVAAR